MKKTNGKSSSVSSFDIKIEADLIEELARIYGYDAIPTSSSVSSSIIKLTKYNHQAISQIREILINRNYQEAITYSFVDPDIHRLVRQQNKTFNAYKIQLHQSYQKCGLAFCRD